MVAVVVADPPLRPLPQSLKPCHRNSKLVPLAPLRTLLRELNKPQASKDNDQGSLARWPRLQRRYLPASKSGDGNADPEHSQCEQADSYPVALPLAPQSVMR